VAELTASVSAPRVAAIEHPFGQNLGPAGDSETQMAVLRATLKALEKIQVPGTIVHLPFEWPEDMDDGELGEPTPIAAYLLKHPFQVMKLIRRQIPN
jgi:hypothetical protein